MRKDLTMPCLPLVVSMPLCLSHRLIGTISVKLASFDYAELTLCSAQDVKFEGSWFYWAWVER